MKYTGLAVTVLSLVFIGAIFLLQWQGTFYPDPANKNIYVKSQKFYFLENCLDWVATISDLTDDRRYLYECRRSFLGVVGNN